MSLIRLRLPALFVTLLFTSSGASAGAAARPPIPEEQQIADGRFVVHFRAGLDPAAAATVLTRLNTAHDTYARLGFRTPLADAATDPTKDPRFDAYLLPAGSTWLGRSGRGGAVSESTAGQDATAGYFYLFEPSIGRPSVIAHEYFHHVQKAYDAWETAAPGGWWSELTAEWAAHTVVPPTSAPPRRFAKGVGMFCDALPTQGCYDDTYGFWPFAKWLEHKVGPGLVRETWERQAVLGAGTNVSHAEQALSDVLRTRGTSLPHAFAAWSVTSVVSRSFTGGVNQYRAARTDTMTAGSGGRQISIAPYGISVLRLRIPKSTSPRRVLRVSTAGLPAPGATLLVLPEPRVTSRPLPAFGAPLASAPGDRRIGPGTTLVLKRAVRSRKHAILVALPNPSSVPVTVTVKPALRSEGRAQHRR